MKQKRFKKLMMAAGMERNAVNHMVKKFQSDLQEYKTDMQNEGIHSYSGLISALIERVATQWVIPLPLITALWFQEEPTIGRQIHILRSYLEEGRRKQS